MTTDFTPTELKTRLKALGLFGLIGCCDEIIDKPWLREVLAIEERERQKRGFERRARDAHVGATKPMVDFDWSVRLHENSDTLFGHNMDPSRPRLPVGW
jgi:hypothetical protein